MKLVSIVLILSLLIGSIPVEVIAQDVTEKGETISEVQPSESHEIKDEVVSQRREKSKTLRRGDNTKTVVVTSDRVNYYDKKKDEWSDIKNTLQTDPSNKDFITNKQNDLKVEFPKKMDNDSPVVVSNNDHSISFKLKDDIKVSSAQIENDVIETSKDEDEIEKWMNRKEKYSRISYAGVQEDTSLVYDIQPSSLKESIVLSKSPKGELKYTYLIETRGLTGKLLKDNSIEFYEKGGKEPVFVLPVPYMFDSNSKGSKTSTDIEVSFNQTGSSTYELTYAPSGEWLKDKNRVYPVTIDPTVTLYTWDVMFSPESTFVYGENICFKYPKLPELNYYDITNAEFHLSAKPLNLYIPYERLKLYELTSSWNTVQNNTYTYNHEMVADSYGPTYKGPYYDFYITELVRKWYSGDNNGMMVSLPSTMGVATPLAGGIPTQNFYLTIDYADPVPASGLGAKRFYGVPGVYSPTGNYSETFTDMTVRTVLGDINLSRTFNSLDMTAISAVGKGFSFNYGMRMFRDLNYPGKVHIIMPGGAQWGFTQNGSQYVATNSNGKLTSVSDGYILETLDQKRYGFDYYGYLEYIEDQNKNRINFKYAEDRITDIIDNSGASIHFNYNNDKTLLQSITDNVTGKKVSYEYKDGRLTQVTGTDGRKTIYEYTNGLLTGVTLASLDGTLKQKTVMLTYSEGFVKTMTDGTGLVTTYTYDFANQKTRVENSAGRNSYEIYNGELAITSVVDNNAPEDENTEKTEYAETSAGVANPEKPKSSTDKYGNVTQYEYDVRGNLIKTTYPYPDYSTEISEYDENNNQTKFIDKSGAVTWYYYDNNRLTTTIRPIDGTSEYWKYANSDDFEITTINYYPDGTYATDGLVKSETDPRGNVTSYTYDDQGRILTTTKNIDGKAYTTTNKYDNAGRLEFTIDPEGVRTEYFYNASDQPVLATVTDNYAVQDPKKTPRFDTKITRTVYDGLGRTKQEIGEMQYQSADDYLPVDLYRDSNVGTRYTYYNDGKTESQTDPIGNTTKYIYDKANGNLVTEIQPNLSQKEYTYDDQGRITSESFREKSTDKNAVILQTIDYSRGNVTETTDYLEGNQIAVTREKYGWDGRLLEKISPNGMIQRNKYDIAGRVKKEEYLNQNGTQVLSWVKYDYDPWGRVKEKESAFDSADDTNSALNAITTYTYDKYGKVKTEEVKNNAAGQAKSVSKTEYEYDTQGNKVLTTIYEGVNPKNYIQSVYDWSGKLLREYKGLTRKLSTTELNSTIQNPSALGYSVIQNKYDCLGNLIEKTDAMGNVESYKYDKAGRLTYTKDRNGAEHTVEYDNNDNPEIKTSKKSGAQTVTKTFDYDSMGNLETETEGNKKIEYKYDAHGNQTKEIDGNVEKTFVYNTAGLVTNYIIKVDNVQKQSVKNTYDSTGNIETVMENNVLKVKYKYDLLDRLIKTETYTDSQTTLTETNEYNYAGLVTRTANAKVSSNVNSVLSQYDYTYYYDGNQRTKKDGTGMTSYIYDGQGQLIKVGSDIPLDNTSIENAVMITSETSTSVSIDVANQVRYFSFTPTTTGTYTIASTDNGTSDPYGYLYASNGTQLAYDDNSDGNRNFKVSYTLNAGTQYVIGAKMYSTGTGSYTFTITPPNNTSFVNAAGIISETPTSVNINAAYLMRYFSFTPATTGTYIIASTDNGGSDPYGYMYSSNGTQLTYDDDSNGSLNFKIAYTLNAGTQYVIGVKMYSSGTGSYSLTITPPDNTTFANAKTIKSGTPTSVSINAANQVKYFRFTPDTTASYIITSADNGSSDPYCYLYASDGTQIAYNDDGNGNRNFKIEYKLNAGTQYVIGAKMFSTGIGNYSFTISQQYGSTTVQEYAYDANGNRKMLKETNSGVVTQTTYTYDNNDCLLTEETGTQTITYNYDANGNLLSKTGGATQTFDLLNRMTTWSGNGKNATYTYDPGNMRDSKVVNDGATTVNTKHVWINDQIALDIGSTTVRYVRGNKLIYSSAYGWYLYNAHDDVVQLTDDSGTVTRNYDYDPFGVLAGNTSTADNNPYRYCGEYYDIESGYTYLRARYYDSKNGRFVSEDSAMDGDNWYVYCGNDPLNMIDPSGHWAGQVKGGQYGGIYDPKAYLKDRYGGTITEKSSKFISMNGFPMSYINNGPICSKAAITRILYYYSYYKGYNKIPTDIKTIYSKVRSFDSNDSTDFWYINNIAQKTLRSYGYSKSTSWNDYAWTFEGAVKSEIDNGYPSIMNIARGYYGNHSVTVAGYKVFNRAKKGLFGTSNKKYPLIAVYDGWVGHKIRYIDYNDFAHNFWYSGFGSFTKIRVKG